MTNFDIEPLKAVDFFCSGGGMSYGLQRAGIKVLAGLDIDKTCKETYEHNILGAKFIECDLTKYSPEDLKKEIKIKKRDKNTVFIGCSPCQFWTIINTDKKKSAKSKHLLKDFYRFVEFYRPGFVVVENVPGIYHNKNNSGLDRFVSNLTDIGYEVEYKVVNLNDFGVPQSRKRFSLIGNRVSSTKVFPIEIFPKPVVKDFIGKKNGFRKINSGHRDSSEFMHSSAKLSPENLDRIKLTPPNGGSRAAWENTNLQLNSYKKHGSKSFSDTYGRLSWNKPSSTITTKFFSLSNGRFGHPEENRALSLREGAALQTFPKDYIFKSNSMINIGRMIGNAVPPKYGESIGKAILKALND